MINYFYKINKKIFLVNQTIPHKTLFTLTEVNEEVKNVKPMWVMGSPLPSPIVDFISNNFYKIWVREKVNLTMMSFHSWNTGFFSFFLFFLSNHVLLKKNRQYPLKKKIALISISTYFFFTGWSSTYFAIDSFRILSLE